MTSVAGCFGENAEKVQERPDAIGLNGGKQCDVCGMVIGDHAGPNGQIFYDEHSPEAHDNPAWFDALKACLFPYYFQHKRRDWNSVAIYVTDYSITDYTISTRGGTKYVSSHTEPETFANADGLHYVVESTVHGAMGADFLPFSDRADAEAFTDEHDGRIVSFDDITPELLAQ